MSLEMRFRMARRSIETDKPETDREEKERERPGDDDRRHAEALRKQGDSSGQPRPDLWRKGIAEFEQLLAAQAPPPSGAVTLQWTQIGPAPLCIDKEQSFQGEGPVSGEVTDIAIDPSGITDQTLYIATNDGGIWKSADGGLSWAPMTDNMKSLSMGAVALDPAKPSTVYAGTGNGFDGGGQFTRGIGLYVSGAGGGWSILGEDVLGGASINRLMLPTSEVLLVATNRGLFRSADEGKSFGANAPLYNDRQPILSGFVSDLALDTRSPATTVYACVAGQGVLQSLDAGATFPKNLFDGTGSPSGPYGNIAFAQSTRPDNNTMYVSVQGSPKGYRGLFKSTDGGNTWAYMPNANDRFSETGDDQAGYDLTVGVDPQDRNRVYLGFQELFVSTDGARTFHTPACTRGKVHWDHHALVFSPPAHWGSAPSPPTRLYVGTDGGIATSADGGLTWSNLNEGIATNLFLGIDIGRGSAGNNRYTYGGTQDTGTVGHRPGDPGADWHLGVDGDGGPVCVDPANPLNVYGRDDGLFIRTRDGGDNWEFPDGKQTNLPSNLNFLVLDQTDSRVIYAAAANQLFRSTDAGDTFALVHSFLANNNQAVAIQSIASTAADFDRMWVGLADGTVQRTGHASAGPGASWLSFSPGAGGRSVEGIAIDPSDIAHVVVVYSGYSAARSGQSTGHVFVTTKDGAEWKDISGNLPDLPLHSVVLDPITTPSTIIAASDAGVVQTTDGGASWQVHGVGLPRVCCTSLAIDWNAKPRVLRVGTYGRSVFELVVR